MLVRLAVQPTAGRAESGRHLCRPQRLRLWQLAEQGDLQGLPLMRPTGVEPATFGLKDRRSLGPRKDPLTTELRALRWELYPRSEV